MLNEYEERQEDLKRKLDAVRKLPPVLDKKRSQLGIDSKSSPIEDRRARRGCRNCLYLHASTCQCAIRATLTICPPEGWCGEWRSAANPRLNWATELARNEET